MHQLTCNGVLEGIRICMRGFPNRWLPTELNWTPKIICRALYPDFRMRYYVLGADEINSSQDNKVSTYALMDKIGFDRQRYRLGHTIIFFRAGALAGLEGMTNQLYVILHFVFNRG